MSMRVLATSLFVVFSLALAVSAVQKLPSGFVHLDEVDASIVQDVRYATHHNFIGWPMYGMTSIFNIIFAILTPNDRH